MLLHDCKASISRVSIDKTDIVGSLHHSRPMKRLTPKTLVVLALVAAASVAGFFSSFRGENRPIIDVPLHCLDLGTVLVQNDMRWKIFFRNPGGKPVPVSRLRASCRCVGLTPASFVIPPRATINVSTRLDLGPALLRPDGPEWTPTEWHVVDDLMFSPAVL